MKSPLRSLVLLFSQLSACLFVLQSSWASSASEPPEPMREFRAAWVATVSNIDWPSRPGLPPAEQKKELIAILDRAVELKLNAIILQVRPACDALYFSRLEPWSEYLSGTMGTPPSPPYDPLQFAIEESHKRALELHAWFNPFRARHPSGKSNITRSHISHKRPDLVKQYGRYLWLDPGERDAQLHSLNVIIDVLRRYDVDGIHLDDYFYPYKVKDTVGKVIDFPDEVSWDQYQSIGGKLERNERRRENINYFIRSLYANIKKEKPWVQFGISPFGIWRPGHPEQIRGLDSYNELYADSRKWLNQGWLDYFVPQLYWAIDPPAQSYTKLLGWWARENKSRRHVWPGIASYKADKQFNAKEIPRQIRISRGLRPTMGHVHWNMSGLMRKGSLDKALKSSLYAAPALAPASPWLDKQPPPRPKVGHSRQNNSKTVQFSWNPGDTQPIRQWVFQTYANGKWTTQLLPARQFSKKVDISNQKSAPSVIAIGAVDRFGHLGERSVVSLK